MTRSKKKLLSHLQNFSKKAYDQYSGKFQMNEYTQINYGKCIGLKLSQTFPMYIYPGPLYQKFRHIIKATMSIIHILSRAVIVTSKLRGLKSVTP